MARLLNSKTTRLYRTLVRKLVAGHDGGEYWTETVYGPYDSKAVNRDYDWGVHHWNSEWTNDRHVLKQELKPTFVLTPMKGLILGLEWVTYEQDGVHVHEH